MKTTLIKALKKEKVMKLSELYRLVGNRTTVLRAAAEGIIQRLGGGYYGSNELDPLVASIAVAAKYYPEGVVSNRTSLVIHGFAQDYIEKVDLDISRRKNIKNRFLKIHRVPEIRLIGITNLNYFGIKVKTYDAERALTEAYRIDPKGGYFYKALKRYIAAGKIRVDLIKKYDEVVGTKVLQHLRQELADG